ncbi:MAG: hypothetical protein L0I29_03885 [Hyphomicrobiales bacterium]|nr:hypothetical protein [Hyphomicrobiales bacterium]
MCQELFEFGFIVSVLSVSYTLPKHDLPLSIVLDACPNMLEIVTGDEIRHRRDF